MNFYSTRVEMAELDWDKVKANVETLYAWMYWIVGLIIAFTISYVLYTRFDKQVASLLVFITSVMALYYYYVKWFVIPAPAIESSPFCPDFMTLVGLHASATTDKPQFVCVDKVGISSLFSSDMQGNIKTDVGTLNEDGAGVVSAGNGGNGYVITPVINAENIGNFCSELKAVGLTWVDKCK